MVSRTSLSELVQVSSNSVLADGRSMVSVENSERIEESPLGDVTGPVEDGFGVRLVLVHLPDASLEVGRLGLQLLEATPLDDAKRQSASSAALVCIAWLANDRTRVNEVIALTNMVDEWGFDPNKLESGVLETLFYKSLSLHVHSLT